MVRKRKSGRNISSVPDTNNDKKYLYAAFPFRPETAEILEKQMQTDNAWQLKYALGLIYAGSNNIEKARPLFIACQDKPNDPVFYAVRAGLLPGRAEGDLQKAISMDKEQWRFYKLLGEYWLGQGMYAKALPLVESYYTSHPENYIMGMLYAKTLLLNQKFRESDIVLAHLNIIPFEGATEGRQLYREAKLMEAIGEMRNKNFNKAMGFINEAKLWPENLGEGKPYEKDIDERLENWMSYRCYNKMGKTNEANAALQRIIGFDLQTDNTLSNIYSANALVTAWAMDKTGKTLQRHLPGLMNR